MSTSKHSTTTSAASVAAVRPKEIASGNASTGGNFQSLVAGWEYNSCIGKGVTATAVATFPSKSSMANLGPVPRATIQPTTITVSREQQKQSPSNKWTEGAEEVIVEEIKQYPPARPSTIFSPTASLSSHYHQPSHYYSNSNLHAVSPSISVATPLTPSRNAALREQFLLSGTTVVNGGGLSHSGSSSSLAAANTGQSSPTTSTRSGVQQQPTTHYHFVEQTNSMTPTTPTYGGSGYRYAGVERLAARSKIYESPASSPSSNRVFSANKGAGGDSGVESAATDKDVLNSKREYYYRDAASPTSSLTNGATTATASNKDYTARETSLGMGFNGRNNNGDEGVSGPKPSSVLAKEGSTEHFVGFSYLPNQIHRKTVKKGFEFTLMVVGESGMGKSTLVNSMFLTDIYGPEYPGPSKRASKTTAVETTRVHLKEKLVNLHLTVVDTPGFGDKVNNTDCWAPIVDFIESRYEEYLNSETRVHRTHIADNRVHVCLYFIAPSGHSLKPIDVECMLKLHDKVNIIPVIAKADTLTPEELTAFKKNIMSEIAKQNIKVYDFPECDEEEDGKLLKSMKSRVPFAVVGSNYVLEIGGERKRGRKYPWGVVEIENLEHCDFQALRNLLIRHYMLDLLETTNNVHYENYRCRKLTGISPDVSKKGKDNKNPLAQMEEEKKEHDLKMKKMEKEMEQVFEQKVKEKLQKLRESEEEYTRRHEEMTKKLEQQRHELEEKRAHFEKEKAAFELVSKDMEEIRRVNTLDVNMRDMNLDGKIKEKKKKGLF